MNVIADKVDDLHTLSSQVVLLCRVGSLRFGVDVLDVSEVTRELPLEVPFPRDSAVAGLTTLRGRCFLIVDLARLIGIAPSQPPGQGRFVALRDHGYSQQVNGDTPGETDTSAGDDAAQDNQTLAPISSRPITQALCLRVDAVETLAEVFPEPSAQVAGPLRPLTADDSVVRLAEGPLIPVFSVRRVVAAVSKDWDRIPKELRSAPE